MGRTKRKSGQAPTKLSPKITAFCITRAATHSIGAIVNELCSSIEFPSITKNNPPPVSSIHYQIKKFRTKFTILDLRKNHKSCAKRPISTTGEENTLKVKKIHDEMFRKFRFKKHASVRYIEHRTGISNRSVRIINKARLRLKFYRRTKTPKSTPNSVAQRIAFSDWGNELFETCDGQMIKKIELLRDFGIYVDETLVELTPPYNPQNQGIHSEKMPTGDDNTHQIVTKAKNVMAYVCVSKLLPDNGIYMHWVPPGKIKAIGYHKFLKEEIIPALKQRIGDRNWKKVWWLEDGAPAHHSHLVSDFLDTEFNGKVVGCDFLKWHPESVGANWPAYSCDLTVNDFYVNSEIKKLTWNLEYQTGVIQNLNDLRRNFEMACYSLELEEVTRAIDAVPERLEMCRFVDGGRFEKYKCEIRKKLSEK